jgi:NADPH:quinone reductase-like Zn-dependent oxidoreductase
MKAAVYERYGPADVVEIRDVARPAIKSDQVLVEVLATTVTTADWRVRASAFPGGMWLMGRLIMGLFRPRHKVLGGEFAGRIVETGADVTRFKTGDEVFGFSASFGAHAAAIAIPQIGAIAKKPENLNFEEAAAVPFGALTALAFLRDFGKVEPGSQVLVAAASGGVGVYGVQIAKHLGAEVAAVCSKANHDLVKSLGADHVIDYRTEDFAAGGERYDLIFDTAGTTNFDHARKALKPNGVFMPLEFGIADAFRSMVAAIFGNKKLLLRISGDSKEELETIAGLVERGEVRPVIDGIHAFDDIRQAYQRVEGRHKTGSVVLRVAEA